ncbi:MAG: peptidylprolyl isomerase, partial [Pseudomonadota bacterium]
MTVLNFIKGAALAAMVALPGAASAQSLFDTVIQVNDDAISRYELDQRTRFFRVLNRPGNVQTLARESLIDDRLRMQAARQFGMRLTPEGLEEEMGNFAARANLSLAEFTTILNR